MWSMFSCAFAIFLLCAFVFCYCTPCEYNLLLESAFLKDGPVWNSFLMIYLPQDISWGRVSLIALSDLWLLRPLQHIFYGIYINLNQLMALCPLKLSSLVTISSFFKSLKLILFLKSSFVSIFRFHQKWYPMPPVFPCLT